MLLKLSTSELRPVKLEPDSESDESGPTLLHLQVPKYLLSFEVLQHCMDLENLNKEKHLFTWSGPTQITNLGTYPAMHNMWCLRQLCELFLSYTYIEKHLTLKKFYQTLNTCNCWDFK